MPLAHNLNKVNKKVNKSNAAIHVKGRNFKRLNRASLRQKKLEDRKAQHLEQKQNELQIVKYFQEEVNLATEKEVFGLIEMKAYIENFLKRYDEELDQLKAERRKGRPPTTRQLLLEEKVKYDENIYETGIKIPDVSDAETVRILRSWNGTIGGASILKYIHVSKDMQQLPTKELEMS